MKKLFYIFVFIVGFISSNVFAADKVITCNFCSVSSHNYLAKQAVPRHVNSMLVHVFDHGRKTLHSYMVINERDIGPSIMTFVAPIQTPAPIFDKYTDYVNALEYFEVLKNAIDVVPEHVASSAWDMVGDPAARQRVGDWFQSSHSVYSALTSVINLATGLFGHPAITLTFEFADGSTAKFKFQSIDSNNDMYYQLVPVQSRDADGNTLEFSGSNNFGGSMASSRSLSDFLAAAARAGIPIIVNGGTIGGGVPVRCVRNGSGGITCTPVNSRT
ncbi:hypothetical protein [Pleionea sp. CnH1-48]|uniref:hypothetical protein n=1 Tax=Pleionea sp. CnH1-48 TaxID=2954494 RepID=UPI0020974F6B|nr:hypothetical protein [Pleionea sp. CnH1-48]MCO7223647.1 hypothetical protein [Pleionea sp. CnH1-48]